MTYEKVQQARYTTHNYFFDQIVRALQRNDEMFNQASASEEAAALRFTEPNLSVREEFEFVTTTSMPSLAIAYHKPTRAAVVLQEYSFKRGQSAAYIIGTPEAREQTKNALERLTGYELREESQLASAR